MKKRILYLCVTLITICILATPGELQSDWSGWDAIVKADEGDILQEPKLVIGRSASIPAFKAGEESTLLVPVENLHQGTARNVNVSLLVDDHSKFPFQIENMSLQTGMVSIGSRDTEMARFTGLKVAPGAESKIYPLSVKVDYTSESGREGSATGTIFVKIINDKQVNLRVMDLLLDDETLDSGVSTEIKLQIKNEGDFIAKDIEVKMSGFTATGLRLDQPLDTLHVNEMKAGEFKALPFKVYADPNIESGSYALDVTIKYKNESNLELTTESKVYLTIEGKSGAGKNIKSSPRLIIENYDYGNDYVRPGDIFELYLSFLNTSRDKDIYNIKISLTSDDNVFSPVNSGSSFVTESIPAGTSMSRSIPLKSKLDAASKTYNITANLEYEDQKGNQYTDKEIIGVAVIQEGKLMVPILDKPEEAFVGLPLGLSATYFNTGKAAIRNLMIHTEGDFEIRDGEEFVGNLEPGKSDYFEVTLTPRHEGICTGSMVFSYNDEMGQTYEVKKDFEIEAMPAPQPPMMEGPEMAADTGQAGWKTPLGIALLLLLLGAAAFVIVRKRHRKRLEDVNFDE